MPRLMMSCPWRCSSAALASTAKAFSSPMRSKAGWMAVTGVPVSGDGRSFWQRRAAGARAALDAPPSRLKQRLKFLQAESGLFDDGTKSAWLEVAARMDRHSDRSRPVAREDHNVMTADDPICHESWARQGSNDAAAAVQDRQLSVSHALGCDRHAADFRRRVGGNGQAMSAAIGQNGADRLLGVQERLSFGVSLGHRFRQSRNEHSKAAVRLRLQDDRKTIAHWDARVSVSSRGLINSRRKAVAQGRVAERLPRWRNDGLCPRSPQVQEK